MHACTILALLCAARTRSQDEKLGPATSHAAFTSLAVLVCASKVLGQNRLGSESIDDLAGQANEELVPTKCVWSSLLKSAGHNGNDPSAIEEKARDETVKIAATAKNGCGYDSGIAGPSTSVSQASFKETNRGENTNHLPTGVPPRRLAVEQHRRTPLSEVHSSARDGRASLARLGQTAPAQRVARDRKQKPLVGERRMSIYRRISQTRTAMICVVSFSAVRLA